MHEVNTSGIDIFTAGRIASLLMKVPLLLLMLSYGAVMILSGFLLELSLGGFILLFCGVFVAGLLGTIWYWYIYTRWYSWCLSKGFPREEVDAVSVYFLISVPETGFWERFWPEADKQENSRAFRFFDLIYSAFT